MIEREGSIELVPITDWVTFQSDLTVGENVAAASTDLVERKRRQALRLEERAAAKLAVRLGKGDALESQSGENAFADQLYAEDAGLDYQKKKKLKGMLKNKRSNLKRDNETVEHSALNMGMVRRAEVDWDFADDGKATDDEEDVEEGDVDELNNEKNDFESEDDEPEVLTKFGKQVTTALEAQKEQDAKDELAQFSDDEDDEGDEKRSSEPSDAASKTPAPATKAGKVKDDKVEDSNSPEAIRSRVIRTLSLHGGRMPTKTFIQSFHITSNKSELFKILQTTIKEVCEVHTQVKDGVPTKILQLIAAYR